MKYECGNCGNGFNDLEAIEDRDSCPFCGVEWDESNQGFDIDPPDYDPLPDINPDPQPYPDIDPNPNPSPQPYWRRHIWRGDNKRWNLGTNTEGSYNVEVEIVEEDEGEYFSQRSR